VTHPLLIAAAAASLFRVVPLACSDDRLAIAGGGVVRLAAGASCAGIVPGKAIAIELDADGRATPRALDPAAHPASAADVPKAAYVLAPVAPADADTADQVVVTIDVFVPPRTPATDDIYLSTDRSDWNPAEIRMDRVDPRHYRLGIPLRRGARLAFRVTRGSFGTTERDAARALPPAHVVIGAPNVDVRVTVAAWADID